MSDTYFVKMQVHQNLKIIPKRSKYYYFIPEEKLNLNEKLGITKVENLVQINKHINNILDQQVVFYAMKPKLNKQQFASLLSDVF